MCCTEIRTTVHSTDSKVHTTDRYTYTLDSTYLYRMGCSKKHMEWVHANRTMLGLGGIQPSEVTLLQNTPLCQSNRPLIRKEVRNTYGHDICLTRRTGKNKGPC